MLNPDLYWPAKLDTLCVQLVEVTAKLCELREQQRAALVEHKRTYYHAFYSAGEVSVAARERQAEYDSYAHWAAVQDVNTDIAMLEDERRLIETLLEIANARERK